MDISSLLFEQFANCHAPCVGPQGSYPNIASMTNLLEELAREWYACVQIIENEGLIPDRRVALAVIVALLPFALALRCVVGC
jgi:hypothetical protein